MQQLETIKGKAVVTPSIVKRYTILYYDFGGWKLYGVNLYTTPESAIQEFFKGQEAISDKKYRAEYYKVFELDLEIPFVPKI